MLANNMKNNNLINKYALTFYFVLSYLIMIISVMVIYFWFLPAPGTIIGPGLIFLYISISSPTISAIIIAALVGGWQEVKNLLSGFLKWRVGFFWYFAGFFLLIGPLIFAGIYLMLGGQAPGPAPGLTIPIILINLFLTLLRGPLTEEAGWRGFALPRLQSKFNAMTSSIILSIIWACWHIPLYFIESRLPFYIFIALVIVITILMTWGYNNTNGSLIITVIFHFSFNFNGAFITGLFGLLPQMIFYIGGGVMITVYVIIVIIYAGPRKLTRKDFSKEDKKI